jgi:DNA-directed RNA polymerase specialized sigma24 family protein
VGAWLQTTARHASVRTAIAARREEPVDQEALVEPPAPAEAGDPLEAAERSAALADALQQLPQRHQKLMQMLLADSAPSYAEISAALDMPIGSIGPTRARCLERLRGAQDLMSVMREDLD